MNPHITPNTLGIGRITLQNALLVAHISILLIMYPAYQKVRPIVNPSYTISPYRCVVPRSSTSTTNTWTL